MVNLMKLDHVPARVIDKDLFGSRSVDLGHRPVRHLQPIKLWLLLLDVSNRERDVRDRRVLSRSLAEIWFDDSPLEGAVCCELVSEMELAKPVFWDVDGKMDPFPQAVGHLNDWYYAYFSNARLAPAAHFPVYQRDLFKTSGFLVNYGSKAHDIGGLDRNDRHRSPYRLMAASRLMTSARAPQTLWRDEQPNPRTGNATSL